MAYNFATDIIKNFYIEENDFVSCKFIYEVKKTDLKKFLYLKILSEDFNDTADYEFFEFMTTLEADGEYSHFNIFFELREEEVIIEEFFHFEEADLLIKVFNNKLNILGIHK